MNVFLLIKNEIISHSLSEFLKLEKRIRGIMVCNDIQSINNKLPFRGFQLAFISTDFEFHALRSGVEYLMQHGVKVVLLGKKSTEIEIATKWRVFDFVSLPLNDNHLKLLLLIIQRTLFESSINLDRDIFFKIKNSKLIKINLKDINYIEALANHVNISFGCSDRIVVYSTMKGIENLLPSHYFMRIHNSYIVHLSKITGIDGNNVVINSKHIPVSRSNWKTLMEKLETV